MTDAIVKFLLRVTVELTVAKYPMGPKPQNSFGTPDTVGIPYFEKSAVKVFASTIVTRVESTDPKVARNSQVWKILRSKVVEAEKTMV